MRPCSANNSKTKFRIPRKNKKKFKLFMKDVHVGSIFLNPLKQADPKEVMKSLYWFSKNFNNGAIVKHEFSTEGI